MKFTLAKLEVQALLAKAMGIPADTVSITAKELAVEVTKNVEDLSFHTAPAPAPEVAEELLEEEEATEEAPAKTKTKPRAKPKAASKAKAPVVEEEEIDAEEIADDDDDIDFL